MGLAELAWDPAGALARDRGRARRARRAAALSGPAERHPKGRKPSGARIGDDRRMPIMPRRRATARTRRRRSPRASSPRTSWRSASRLRRRSSQGARRPRRRQELISAELMLDGNARLNLATFVTTWMEPQAARADGRVRRQEHDRQGRVPADGRAGAALRRRCSADLWHAPDRDAGRRLLDDRARARPACSAALALKRRWREAQRGRRQAGRQAEPGHGHQRPDLLGQVLQLLGGRAEARADGGRPLHLDGRGGRRALRREHDRRGGDPGVDVRRHLRAGRRDLRRARRPAGADRPRHPDPRRRGVGRAWSRRSSTRS